MASTIALQRTVNVAQIYLRQAPLTGVGGVANEPALSNGDWVRQFILGPPFAWRWNRATTTITTVAGTQDYPKSLSDFGWLEQASLNGSGGVFELEVALNLADDTAKNLPTKIAARLDNDNGSITFRLLPVPDQVYTIYISYQKAAPLFTALVDTWTPIPDYLSYLYNQGFLAKAYEYLDGEKYPQAMQLFIQQVISANAGLTESQVNIFLSGSRAVQAAQRPAPGR